MNTFRMKRLTVNADASTSMRIQEFSFDINYDDNKYKPEKARSTTGKLKSNHFTKLIAYRTTQTIKPTRQTKPL